MKTKFKIKAIIPATVVRVFEVEATNREEAYAEYLKGESYEVEEATTTTHDNYVEFEIREM
jgi:hypothetical protein